MILTQKINWSPLSNKHVDYIKKSLITLVILEGIKVNEEIQFVKKVIPGKGHKI